MRERTSLGRDALLAAALLLGGLALPACILPHQPKWYESDQEVNGSWAVVARKTAARPAPPPPPPPTPVPAAGPVAPQPPPPVVRPAQGPTCGSCGQAVKPGDKECSRCGAPLGQ